MKKRICQITVTLLTVAMLTISASATQISCTNSAVSDFLTQLLLQELECRGIVLPDCNTKPPVVEPPVIEPPVVEPPVIEPPIIEPPIIEPPVTEPPVIEPPVVEPPVIEPPIIEPPVIEPPVVEPPVIEPPVVEPPVTSSISAYEMQVITLVNEIRSDYGLKPLTASEKLSDVARAKSEDMKRNSYFAHNSPTYGSPFDMLKSFGVSYRTAGENIAFGYSSPRAVVDAWMNSEGHRENILKVSYTEIGVGYYANGHYWTQLFTG